MNTSALFPGFAVDMIRVLPTAHEKNWLVGIIGCKSTAAAAGGGGIALTPNRKNGASVITIFFDGVVKPEKVRHGFAPMGRPLPQSWIAECFTFASHEVAIK